jgi:hypothetical protein
MSDSILTEIEHAMSDYISEMSVGTGYNFDWGSVNEPDVARQTFPSAEIAIVSETNRDDTDGVWSQGYEQEVVFALRIRVSIDNEEMTPAYAVNADLNKALDDIKRLFGNHYTMSDYCETLMYMGMVRVTDARNDIFRPSYMDVQIRCRYTQDRKNPLVNAE